MYINEDIRGFLKKHGSSLSEAGEIVGVSRRTFTRCADSGELPELWDKKLWFSLCERYPKPPEPRKAAKICSVCGEAYLLIFDPAHRDTTNAVNDTILKHLGVEDIPKSGWHWAELPDGHSRDKMYPICRNCWKKWEGIKKTRMRGKTRVKEK